jgi:hypothetical protein
VILLATFGIASISPEGIQRNKKADYKLKLLIFRQLLPCNTLTPSYRALTLVKYVLKGFEDLKATPILAIIPQIVNLTQK